MPGTATIVAGPGLSAWSYAVDSSVDAWVMQIRGLGSDVPSGSIPVFYRFVSRLKAASLWNSISYIGIRCGISSLAGLAAPLKTTGSNGTLNGFVSGDYNPAIGLLGGTSKYIDSGVTFSGTLPNYHHCGVVTSSYAALTDSTLYGAENASTQRVKFKIANAAAGNSYDSSTYHSSNQVLGNYPDSKGIYISSYTASPNRFLVRRNNLLIGNSSSSGAGSSPTVNMYELAHNNNGTAAEFSPVRLAYTSWGATSFTASQCATYYQILWELMNGLGVDFSTPYIAPQTEYDGIIFTGQSNSVGYNTSALTTTAAAFGNLMPSIGVGAESNSTFRTIVPLRAINSRETLANGMADSLSSRTGRKYVISSVGLSSATYAQIAKNGSSNIYDHSPVHVANLQALCLKLATPGILTYRAAVLVHGEADDTPSSTNYNTQIATLQSNLESDIQAATGRTNSIPLIVTQHCSWCTGNRSTPTSAQQQYLAAKNNPTKIALIPTYFLSLNSVDGLHYTKESHRWLGEYVAKAYYYLVHLNKPFNPMMPTSVSRSGQTITISFDNAIGPIVFDTSYVSNPGGTSNATNLYGFEVADSGGTLLTLASASITDKTVTIVASSGTPAQLRHAWTAPSLGLKTGPTNGSRGNLRDSDPTASYYTSTAPWLYNYCPTFMEAV